MNNSDLDDLESMVGTVLAREIPTPCRIREQITRVRRVFPSVTDDQAEALARRFEHVHGVKMTVGATLEGKGFEKWLDGARATIEPVLLDALQASTCGTGLFRARSRHDRRGD